MFFSQKFRLLLLYMVFISLIIFSCQKKIENNISVIDDNPIDDDTIGTVVDFDTSLTRFYSDINTFGLYIGKTGPTDAIEDMTNFRVLETLRRDSAIACAKRMNSRYIRLNINKDLWDNGGEGKKSFLDYCLASRDANLGGVVNINYHESDFSTPEEFATPAEYIPFLTEVLDSMNANRYRPYIIVVENEEFNPTQYQIDVSTDENMYRDIQKYIDQLAAAVQTCNSYVWWDGKVGVDATNGGFLPRDMCYTVWKWLRDDKDEKALAEYFGTNAFSPYQYDQIDKTVIPRFADVRTKMNVYITEKMNEIPMKYVNYHWNEPSPMRGWSEDLEGGTPADFGISPDSIAEGVLDLAMLYYHDRMPNKLLITNEMYIITYSIPLFTQVFNKMIEHPYLANNIAIFYDADSGDFYRSKGFHNTFPGNGIQFSYSLRSTGIELSRRLQNLK